jgi:hypothetical protein
MTPRRANLVRRALAVWCILLAIAFINGTIRVIWIIPRLGDYQGHVVSSLLLSAAIVVVAGATIRWVHPVSTADALLVGIVWLALTLVFEFGAGHYLFGRPWSVLLQDYDLARGRLWILVLVTTAAAPLLAARARRTPNLIEQVH